jgi:hypothetical protein
MEFAPVIELDAHEKRLHCDALTGLPDRRVLDRWQPNDAGQNELSDPLRAVLWINLDGLTEVNDVAGFEIGDDLLVQFTSRLLRCVRAGDVLVHRGRRVRRGAGRQQRKDRGRRWSAHRASCGRAVSDPREDDHRRRLGGTRTRRRPPRIAGRAAGDRAVADLGLCRDAAGKGPRRQRPDGRCAATRDHRVRGHPRLRRDELPAVAVA